MPEPKTYRLTRPCAKCPFRADIDPYLLPGRIDELERSLRYGEFYCHETTDQSQLDDGADDDHYNPDGGEAHCAGALILLEKIERPSQMMRVCERIGLYDRTKLDMKAPVFDSWEAMRDAQLGSRPAAKPKYGRRRRRKGAAKR